MVCIWMTLVQAENGCDARAQDRSNFLLQLNLFNVLNTLGTIARHHHHLYIPIVRMVHGTKNHFDTCSG